MRRIAEILAREFGDAYSRSQFTELENFEVLVKLLDDGATRAPFRAKTLPPLGRRYGRKENLVARSRERYAAPRAVVEDKITRWMKG